MKSFLESRNRKEWLQDLSPMSERHRLSEVFNLLLRDNSSNLDIPKRARHLLSKINNLDRNCWPHPREYEKPVVCKNPEETLCPLVAAILNYHSPDILDVLIKEVGINVNTTWILLDEGHFYPAKEFNALTYILSQPRGRVTSPNCKIRRLVNLGIDTTAILDFNVPDPGTWTNDWPRSRSFFLEKVQTLTVPLSQVCDHDEDWLSHPLNCIDVNITNNIRGAYDSQGTSRHVWPLKALSRKCFNQHFRPLVKGPDPFYQLGLPKRLADYLLYKDHDHAQAGHCGTIQSSDGELHSIHKLVRNGQTVTCKGFPNMPTYIF